MAKATPVRGIKPGKTLKRNARLVIETRLDEFLSWRSALADEGMVTELHDMRIAAKRLRYAFEMFDVCFEVKDLLADLTGIQEDLGTIHDVDVLIELLRDRQKVQDASLESGVVEVMGSDLSAREKSNALRKCLYAHARDADRIGLLGLLGDKIAERQRLFSSFQQRWDNSALDEFEMSVRQAAGLDEGPGNSQSGTTNNSLHPGMDIIKLAGDSNILRFQVTLPDISPHEVFTYWTDAEALCRWWPQHATIEPVAGGPYHLAWPAMNWHLRGHYREFEPGRRLAFTWRWDHDAPSVPSYVVTITLQPHGGRGTAMTLEHGPYTAAAEDQEQRQGHEDGWRHFLARLIEVTQPH